MKNFVTIDPKASNEKNSTKKLENIEIKRILPEEAKILCETITAELPEYFGLPEIRGCLQFAIAN